MPKRLLCPRVPTPGQNVRLSEEEAHHATRVLRLREGDQVEAIDGQGHHAITALVRSGPWIELQFHSWVEKVPPQKNLSITLEIAILKGEAMEWIVEKSVELGVTRLVPILTDHTVVQVKQKGPEVFQQRWQKIADQSLKQCGRLERMEIGQLTSFEKLINTPLPQGGIRWIGDETSNLSAPFFVDELRSKSPLENKPLHFLVGPEGGWSAHEEDLFRVPNPQGQLPGVRVSLGPVILRAETAALFSISVLTAFVRSGAS